MKAKSVSKDDFFCSHYLWRNSMGLKAVRIMMKERKKERKKARKKTHDYALNKD